MFINWAWPLSSSGTLSWGRRDLLSCYRQQNAPHIALSEKRALLPNSSVPVTDSNLHPNNTSAPKYHICAGVASQPPYSLVLQSPCASRCHSFLGKPLYLAIQTETSKRSPLHLIKIALKPYLMCMDITLKAEARKFPVSKSFFPVASWLLLALILTSLLSSSHHIFPR